MEFGLLGPLLVRSGESVIPVPAARQRVLLAALLLGLNRVVSLDELVDTLWENCPPPTARVTVQNYVKRLRQALGDAGHSRIVTQSGGYLIRVGAEELDITRFEALQGQARDAAQRGEWSLASVRLHRALALWRGRPLVDVPCDRLAVREVPRLDEMRLQALEARITADLHLGRHGEVIPELQRLVTAHPLREELHGLLMCALYWAGRQGDALAVYQHARRVLAEELGVEPGLQLRARHQQILASDPALIVTTPAQLEVRPAEGGRAGEPAGVGQDAAAASASGPAGEAAARAGDAVVPRQLPAAAPHFAGRDAELNLLSGLLSERAGTVVISAIGGMAGVGKTALAIHWAHQVAGQFPDGQLYVNLRGFGPSGDPVEPAAAVRGFLDALGVQPGRIPATPDAQAGLYRSVLVGMRMLIIVDNARDEDQVRPLLPATPGCLVVVTSRTQLAGLVAAEGARPVNLDVLTDAEARELLARRLGEDRVAAEPGAVTELIALCGRLPLALAITAARAATHPGFPLAALAAELCDEHSRLAALDAGDTATSVSAVFSWSYQHLAAATARMFRLLGLHPGPDITIAAAASLAAVPAEKAHELLRELARANVLSEQAAGRFALHDLLRAYATQQGEKTDSEDQRRAALTRLFDHYLAASATGTLAPAERPCRPTSPAQATSQPLLDTPEAARTWLDERASFVSIVEFAATHGWPGHTTRLATILSRYYLDLGGQYPGAAATHIRAAEDTGDRTAQADALWSRGTVSFGHGDHRQAADQLWQALAMYRELGDYDGQAHTLCSLGVIHYRQAKYEATASYLGQALALRGELGDRLGEAVTLDFLGLVLWRQGRYEQAASRHQRALDFFREIAFRRGEACALANLGAVSHRLGRYPEAAGFCGNARDVFRELGDRDAEAGALQYLGATMHGRGQYEDAADRHRQALAMFRELGDPPNEVRALNGLGRALNSLGRPGQARVCHQDALALARQIGDPYLEARSYDYLASTCQAVGAHDEAFCQWQHALTIYIDLGVPEADHVRTNLSALTQSWDPR